MDEKPELYPVSIRIKQFQSIEDLEIEVRGFTCISGRTNIGKSAIMRAISSATLGDPVIGLVRKGASYCSVEMSSKNWGFRWEKGEKGINRYIIGDTTYDKPGQKQLEEIIRMGFGSVKLGSKEIQPWWAPQFFPIFLLGETGPAVTDFISEVSRLTVLQDAIVLSSRGKKRANDNAKEKAGEAQKTRERLARVSGTDQMIKLCRELEEQQESIEEYQERIRIGDEFNIKLCSSAQRINALAAADLVQVPHDDAGEAVVKLREQHGFWIRLEASAKKIIVLKPSEKLSIQEPPDEEWRYISEGRRFLIIERLKAKAKTLESVKSIDVPSIPEANEELASIRAGESITARLLSSANAIRLLSTKVEVPESPDDLERLRKGQELSAKLEIVLHEEQVLADKMKAIEDEIAEVDQELATIPSCPACGRPVSSGDHKYETAVA